MMTPWDKMARESLAMRLRRLANQLENGCGNHGCIISPLAGGGTNSGCECSRHNIRRVLEWTIKAYL